MYEKIEIDRTQSVKLDFSMKRESIPLLQPKSSTHKGIKYKHTYMLFKYSTKHRHKKNKSKVKKKRNEILN